MAASIQQIIVLLLIFVIGLLMPYLTRKEIVFGVRVPSRMRASPEIRQFLKAYIRNYISTSGIVALILVWMSIKSPRSIIDEIGIPILLVLFFGNYLSCHRAIKRAKADGNWGEGYQAMSVMDIGYSNRKVLVSPWWFCIPLGLIFFQILLVLYRYDSIPDKILLHYYMKGAVDHWVPKSYGVLLKPAGISIMITALFLFIYKIIGRSKQQLTAENPEESKIRTHMFRRRWSIFAIACNVVCLIPSSLGLLQMTDILDSESGLPIVISIIAPLVIIGSALWLSLSTGQGGSRIKLKNESGIPDYKTDRDDDSYWKLGIIYFNPNDPAIFLEKRFGIGWTINFGNIFAVIILVGILITLFFGPKIIDLLLR